MLFDWTEGSDFASLQSWFRATMTKQRGAVTIPAVVRPRLRVATFNVQMLCGDVFRDIAACEADVLVLNEFWPLPQGHADTDPASLAARLEKELGYRHNSFRSSPRWEDVTFVTVVFSRFELSLVKQHMIVGDRHVVQVELAQWDLCVWGVHLDVYDDTGAVRLKQLQQLHALMEGPAKGARTNVVMAGDCNALRKEDYADEQWAKIVAHDRKRGVVTESKTIEFVQQKMRFADCFALARVQPPLCTTWSGRRIDFVFVRGDAQVTDAFHRPCTSSDHIPVGCTVLVPEVQ